MFRLFIIPEFTIAGLYLDNLLTELLKKKKSTLNALLIKR